MSVEFSSCNSHPRSNVAVPWAKLERITRFRNDHRAKFTWDQYRELLTALSDKKFHVMPVNEMRNTFDSSFVVVGMRHDIDNHPFKALEMAEIERQFGIRATYYVLATADYYGKIVDGRAVRHPEMGALYKKLYDEGAEIGIHNDLLTVMILYKGDPLSFNQDELNYYKSLGIPIYGTAAHGSDIAKNLKISNVMIFRDFATKDSVSYGGRKYPLGQRTLKEYGYEYEAYHVGYNKYYSESRGVWSDPEGLKGIIEKLKASVPGDRIEILTHPVWWGK
jgi:hypothetical protein